MGTNQDGRDSRGEGDEMSEFVCGFPSCRTPVKGVYCDPHRDSMRDSRRAEREKARALAGERMKGLWRTRESEMRANLAKARAARARVATEGK
jgi:hypothetical protein